MSVHAQIAPSFLATVVECPGSVQLSAPHLDAPPTEESLEGDAAHWLALLFADGRLTGSGIIGVAAPNGVIVTEEMVEGAQLWRDTVGEYGVPECPVVIERIHPTECWGTPDWWRHDPIEYVLRVYDYKFGHKFVEVFECWQLIAYVLGLIDTLKLDDLTLMVEFGIVQPRSYHKDGPVRRWTIAAHELRALGNHAADQAALALGPNPPTKTGTHCEFCPGRHECRTLQTAVLSVVEFAGTADRVSLPPGPLGRELATIDDALEILEARRSGLKEQATAHLRRGERVPFYKLESGLGRLAWTAPAAEIIGLGDAFGVNLRKPPAAITPTQAKNLIDQAVISQYADRPATAVSLTRESLIDSKKVFSQ